MNNVAERKVSNFNVEHKVHSFDDPSRTILLFSPGEHIYFHGAMKVSVLFGCIHYNGFTIKPNSGEVIVFSALNSPAMVLHSGQPNIDEGDSNEILTALQIPHIDSVICILQIEDFDITGLTNCNDFKIQGKKRKRYPFLYLSSNTRVADNTKLTTARILMSDCGENQLFIVPYMWENLSHTLNSLDNFKSGIIFGKKSSGKSSLLRFLANKMVCIYGKVALLDCDSGQTELSPPGIVSLTIVSGPLLGLPDTNILTTSIEFQLSHFIGNTTPKNCPDRYTDCILHLASYYNDAQQDEFYSNGTKIPLLINTHGWVEGVGREILNNMALHLQPQVLIQTTDENFNKRFIDTDNIKRAEYSPLEYFVSPIRVEGNIPTSSAIEKRSTQLLNYFSSIALKDNGNISSIVQLTQKYYKVPWESVMLHFPDHHVPPSQAFFALNGSIVGLVISNQELVRLKKEVQPYTGPSFLMSQLDPIESHTIGIGIVKIIDTSTQSFYISTPVPFDLLKRVNVLVKSCLKIDSKLLLQETTMISPYLTSDSIPGQGSGSHEMKTRTNILRKRLQ